MGESATRVSGRLTISGTSSHSARMRAVSSTSLRKAGVCSGSPESAERGYLYPADGSVAHANEAVVFHTFLYKVIPAMKGITQRIGHAGHSPPVQGCTALFHEAFRSTP